MKHTNQYRLIFCILILSLLACCSANAAVDYLKKYQSALSPEAIQAAREMVPMETMDGSKLEMYRFGYAAGYDAALGHSSDSRLILTAMSSAPDREGPVQPEVKTYILNKNTRRFHDPSCSSVSKMSEKNKLPFTGTRMEVINRGYAPCQKCNP